MEILIGISILLASCLAAYWLARWMTGVSMNWALRHGVVSPVTQRSSHSVPTARLGGVGLAAGFALASLLLIFLLAALSGKIRADLRTGAWPYLFLALGWLLMLGIGLLDDLFDLPAPLKLVLTVLASSVPVLLGYFSGVQPGRSGLPAIVAGIVNIATWSFWILFFVNAFNFMDGMDGFAAAFARLSAVFFFAVMILRPLLRLHEPFYVLTLPWLLPVLAAACCGFLYWNRPPAKVFMGDGGSLSLGYLLAVYVFLGAHIRMTDWPGQSLDEVIPKDFGTVLPALTALTILLPFIFDVILTLIRRTRRRENILKAHREHLYQRLMKTGLSHAEVLKINVRRFWIINLAALAGALPAYPAWRWAAFVFGLIVMIHYWRLVLARERTAAAKQES